MSHAALDALALRAQAGDRSALEDLVRSLQDPLFRLSVRFLSQREQARDATQEILILVITKLSTFRGESSVFTWAYRVACNHLLQLKASLRRATFEELEENLGQPASEIASSTLAAADARLLEEEVFLGCTQAMLRALDREQRIAFVLGGICELPSPDAAFALGISEAAFRKRLSRARSALDAFMRKQCGVANPRNACRCASQVNYRVGKGLLDPGCLRLAAPSDRTSLEMLRASRREVGRVRRSLELYQAQPSHNAPEDFAARVRALLHDSSLRIFADPGAPVPATSVELEGTVRRN
jgi:RNA polymerase sigma factor (sigma-70 family)